MARAEIREADFGDLDALCALSRETFVDAFGALYTPDNLEVFLKEKHGADHYRRAIEGPETLVLVAERGGALVGYAAAGPLAVPANEPPEGAVELHRIYVARGQQGEGLGQRLLDAVLAWPPAATAPAVYLSVFSENAGAQRFYAANGFHKTGEYEFAVGTDRDREFIFARPATSAGERRLDP